MLSKHKRPYDAAILPPDKRLSANVRDIFATNQLSGIRTQELINDISDAGVTSFRRMKKKNLEGQCEQKLEEDFFEEKSVAISVLGQDLCEKLADWAGGETMVCIYFTS